MSIYPNNVSPQSSAQLISAHLAVAGEHKVNWEGWLSLGLTVGALALLSLTRVGPHLVMMGVLTVLSALGILSAGEPWLMLVLTYIAVSLLTETITNNAAAV